MLSKVGLTSGFKSRALARLWVLRFPVTLALTAAAAAMATYWRESLGHRGASMFFIAAIVFVGAQFGQKLALLSAILSYAAYHYFLLDAGHPLNLDPTDLLALVIFTFIALLVGSLSGRLSDRARAATERSRELASLLSASKDLAAAIDPEDAAKRTIAHLSHLGVKAAIKLYGDDAPIARSNADTAAGLVTYPINAADRRLGSIAIDAADLVGRKSDDYIAALLDITGIAIDRTRLLKEITQARVISEKEGLRTALLSSLSHDLRTPIATILASASTLADPRHDEALRSDLATAIQEEAERLNRYIANLLEMTRLQSGAIDLRRVPVDPSEITDAALERMRNRFGERTVTRRINKQQNLISADPVLLEQAIVNLIENAIDHAGKDAAITIGVNQTAKSVEFFVEDNGPGIPADEQSVMFEKFFRGKNAKAKAGGVGLGLSVVRGIVEAFDGAVAIKSPIANNRGSAIIMSFPAIAGNEG